MSATDVIRKKIKGLEAFLVNHERYLSEVREELEALKKALAILEYKEGSER